MVSEVHQFSADVNSVLQIVVESLYKNDEVFLRELISNASDALEKRRYQALKDTKKSDEKLGIEIKFDNEYIEVVDNGIGMDKKDLIDHLGQIAHSGTKETIKQLTEAKDANELIGQFGVGFYSAFVVAEEVIVKTRKLGDKKGWVWITKTNENNYSIDEIEQLEVGTSVRLKLKEEKKDFANYWRLQQIVQKYSDHISFPITMYAPKESEDGKKSEEVEATVVNKAQALWTIPKKEITEEQYESYYHHINHHDAESPLLYGDFRVEGKVSFNSIVYVPKKAPFDLQQRENRHGLKLYVQRVFIQDEQDALLPMYLRFVRGMVDTQDLSLNVSREMLQNSPIVEQIKASITKKLLGMFSDLARESSEKYISFWKEFGMVLKEGLLEEFQNRDKLIDLLRFKSSKRNGYISFKDYIEKMAKDQKKIYYLTTDRFSAGLSSPHLEIFNRKNIEVLILDDRYDEWMISHLQTYEKFTLQSIAHGDLEEISDSKKDEKDTKDVKEEGAHKDFFEKVKSSLTGKIKDVKSSNRLTSSPCCLISDKAEMSSHLKRIFKEAGQEIPDTQPILEVNMHHPLVQKAQDVADKDEFDKYVQLLYGQALLMDGEKLENPTLFVKTMNELMTVDVTKVQ